MTTGQIRADFGTLEQLQGDQTSHAGTIENYRADLRAAASQAIGNFAGGMGEEEHAACMRKVDELIDEHIRNTQQFRGTTANVTDTFRNGGQMARNILAAGT